VSDTPETKRLVVGYQVLHDAATDIDRLGPIATQLANNFKGQDRSDIFAVPGLNNYDNPDIGPNTYTAVMNFYSHWAFKMSDAMNGLNQLGAVFRSVGNAFAETDMSMAGSINLAQLTSQILAYPHLMDAHAQALAAHGKENPYTHKFPDGPVPDAPTPPDDPYMIVAPGGPSTKWLYQEAPDSAVPADQKSSTWVNRLLATETTSLTTDGMTWSETTTYSADKGWGPDGPTQDTTQVVTHTDGSTDTIKTTIDPASGDATQVDTSSTGGDPTTSHRTGWSGKWVTDPPPVTDTTPDYVPTNY
jgi:hypothetical protein